MDPAQVDATVPRKRRVKREREAPPPDLIKQTEKSLKRTRTKPYPPIVTLEPVGMDQEEWTPNHSDDDIWIAQLAEAFGTRSLALVSTFMQQLEKLIPGRWWDEEAHQFRVDECMFNTALAMVASVKPRNEMEAALAAQMVAVHFMQMQLSARAMKFEHDTKTAVAASKMARTFVQQIEAMRTIRTGKRTAKQSIKVTKEVHQHVHYHRGDGESVGQPHGRTARAIDQCATLPGTEPGGQVVPLPRRAR